MYTSLQQTTGYPALSGAGLHLAYSPAPTVAMAFSWPMMCSFSRCSSGNRRRSSASRFRCFSWYCGVTAKGAQECWAQWHPSFILFPTQRIKPGLAPQGSGCTALAHDHWRPSPSRSAPHHMALPQMASVQGCWVTLLVK